MQFMPNDIHFSYKKCRKKYNAAINVITRRLSNFPFREHLKT